MGASNSRDNDTSITSRGGGNDRIKYGVAYVQGFAVEMEDAHAVIPDLDHTTSFFGVYDGHGGHEVALLCAKLFHAELRFQPNYQSDLVSAIRSVFSRMDEVLQQSKQWREFVDPTAKSNFLRRVICPIANPWYCKRETPNMPPQNTGSSASVVVIRGNRVIVGNVGDSHCVASRNGQAIQLTTDHKPRHRNERARIERAGGKIDIDQKVVKEPGRVTGFSVLRGLLTTSRAIGDFTFKQNKSLPPEEQIVICNPDMSEMEITNDTEFIVIASHGIWESMTCQGVVDFVHEEFEFVTNPRVVCERLVRIAQSSTGLDITVILIQFNHEAPADEEREDSDSQDIKSNASDDQEIKSNVSDDQEIKPVASDEQEIKPVVSDEQQPFAPNG
ncbi:unnamed protein product [Urochloa humidicola]